MGLVKVFVLETEKTFDLSSLFSLKDKNPHKSHVIYEGECSCGENYVGETMRNLEVRITEHSNICHTSEPARRVASRCVASQRVALQRVALQRVASRFGKPKSLIPVESPLFSKILF